jgi:putative aldouronate transport system substrate-binding protein
MSHPSLSRRGFLAATGGLGLSMALAGCGSSGGSSDGKAGGTSTALLPNVTPTGWAPVIKQVNAKLKKDLGFTLDAQFTAWTNYGQQALLKFTAGASFDTALEALWLNMGQLQKSNSLVDVTKEIAKYPNLRKQLAPKLLSANSWDGHLWGIPQVNSAGRVQHFAIRQDLAEKYGFSDIQDYETLERFFYAVKQKARITPFGASSNQTFQFVVPCPVGLFNGRSWAEPLSSAQQFAGSSLYFIMDRDAAQTGSSSPVPWWEDESAIEAMHTVRKYYQDGIINADAINTDSATVKSRWQAGTYAAAWAITDGTSSNDLPVMRKTHPGARMANIVPLAGGLTGSKPLQSFRADNVVVLNANGGDTDRALQLQDWLSIQANHDLLAYGIEGKDWQALPDNKYKQLSEYSFPGYALLWRSALERRSSFMSASEEKVFDWAQDYDNFTLDPFASFIPDATPVKQEVAQIVNAMTKYANPLYYGLVDVKKGLSQLKSAADRAGLDKLQAELAKQADEYLKNQKKA